MKKLLKWSGIILGSILVLLIVVVLALPFFLPLEKIKDMATQKISESLHRQVKIEKVSFNIFEGIKLEKLTVSNAAGFTKQDFISADAISLRYAFWPLFRREIIIYEIALVKPTILIEKNNNGVFNFNNLTSTKSNVKNKKQTTCLPAGRANNKTNNNFSIIVDTFAIKQAKITYIDHLTNTQSQINNANLKISGITLALLKPIGLQFSALANYQGKDIPVALNGKVSVDLAKEQVKVSPLDLEIAGESANISAIISQWETGPAIDLSIDTKKLSIDPLLAIFAAGSNKPKDKPKKGELTKNINKLTASIPAKLKIKANLNLNNLSILGFKVDKINTALNLANKQIALDLKEIKIYEGILSGKANIDLATFGLAYNIDNLKLQGFNSTPFLNIMIDTFLTKLDNYQDLKDKVYGKLDVALSLKGRGVEPLDAFANTDAKGSFNLSNGELKRVKVLASLGEKIKSNSLKENIMVKALSSGFSLKNEKLNLADLHLEGGDIKINFSGGADLKALNWVKGNRLTLKLSPSSSQSLSQEFDFFRDKQGWFELTFEMTGSLKKPIPMPILTKPMEAIVGKVKVMIEAKKIEIISQAQQAVSKEVDKATEQLKQEATKQLKDLLKF